MDKQLNQLSCKYKFFKSHVVSILLYGFETWTIHAETERMIQAFGNKYQRGLLGISYLEHTIKYM
ncbi:hypothetical protein DPMN_191409 [Dreissena polymorpha]|uniref:Uncharacterized protein n=1 Tax=Dreissena polymorpha TaxID=45954 RepID=A0A9D3Y593_DREPO|nr:hypothetical protein DPMN_191409 [Dreissena polymorpha]